MDESLQKLVEKGEISVSTAKYNMRDVSRLDMYKSQQ